MNYEFIHLRVLAASFLRGDKLSNEDYEFLNGMRALLRDACESMSKIDERINMMEANC